MADKNGDDVTKPMLCNPESSSTNAGDPGFLSPPDGAVAYHGFPLVPEVCADGFCYGAISDFLHFDSDAGCSIGNGFVVAPDGWRAGLTWEVDDEKKYRMEHPPQGNRWGVYYFTVPHSVKTTDDMRDTFMFMLPKLKALHKNAQWIRRDD